jgi:hypothetical protein
MDERRRLQRLPWINAGHPGDSQPAQLVIDQPQEFLRCLGVTLLNPVQDLRDLAHLRDFQGA